MNSLKFTILGCGSSGGVPRIGNDWGACDPANPKNRRRRCSLLVERRSETGVTTVLIDTGPDLREQINDAGAGSLDAVFYTHAHADHIHGIDDLRGLALKERKRVDVYLDHSTSARAHKAFDYCFVTPEGSGYPPILNEHRLHPGTPVAVRGPGGVVTVLPFQQHHGDIDSLGFRIGNVAYSSDLHDLPAASLDHLKGLDVWMVDALRYTPHRSHFTVAEALGWIERLKVKRGILTNLHLDLDFDTLAAELPEGVEPAYDMMTFEVALSG
ncbi:MBL fold metallo-hydrolase [Amorphus orientalis]|uniref:Phosphoribosyl 1,2-cyclic phosphate phosphodiesterase n=1 Tax=Amorphus orientalis TaxID=649198 RepID=A0AAE4AS53_9HYPH|nr:MBL fold metallo-hydrolase [Amorphus orientalis]MDQ0315866.1 phosphoribosyl 1,2-cyclic phosphate phosphodiesterase [Amorphus orientalis]